VRPPGAAEAGPTAVSAATWATAERILAVRLDALGDVLMTTPAIRAIRESRPASHIALLTSPAGGAVGRLIPAVDETIVYEAPWLKPEPAGGVDPAADLAFIDRLAARRFDAAVIFTVHSQSALPAALACHLAGIPLRLAHAREKPYGLLSDWVPDPEPDEPIRHEVRRQLDLVGSVGYRTPDEHLSVRVDPADSRRIRALLADLGLGRAGPWLVVHPGSSAPSRRYPGERYAVVLETLAREGWQIVLTGGSDEVEPVELIREHVAGNVVGAAPISLAGQLSVGELAALLAAAPLLLANNTGPAHLAAAVGTPVVVVYAQTNLQHTPWAIPSRVVTHDVPCAGCRRSVCPLLHHACLRAIAPDEVVDPPSDAGATGSHWARESATSTTAG
jgi:lipopolysaccharide heptosyltransferase II